MYALYSYFLKIHILKITHSLWGSKDTINFKNIHCMTMRGRPRKPPLEKLALPGAHGKEAGVLGLITAYSDPCLKGPQYNGAK